MRCPGTKLQTDERKHVPTQLVHGCCFQEVSASRPEPLWVSPKPCASLWGMRPSRKEIRKSDTVSVLRVPTNFQLMGFRKNFVLWKNCVRSIISKVFLSRRWKCPAKSVSQGDMTGKTTQCKGWTRGLAVLIALL